MHFDTFFSSEQNQDSSGSGSFTRPLPTPSVCLRDRNLPHSPWFHYALPQRKRNNPMRLGYNSEQ